jgi:hypothetical protein
MAIFIFGLIGFQNYNVIADELPYIETQEQYSKQLILDPNFDEELGNSPWSLNLDGDISDVNASIGGGQSNYTIIGEQFEFTLINSTPDISDWTAVQNPKFPILPDTYEINQLGINVSHEYNEWVNQTRNTPSMNWKRNINLPSNMSDYEITSASLTAVANGSALVNVETPTDTLDVGGYHGVDDFVRFYVLISDLNNIEEYELAYNRTVDLGIGDSPRDSYGAVNYMYDTILNTVNENLLIFYLQKVLEHDNFNFTITLGIDVYCEDNYDGYDRDTFRSLLIKSCDLSFTYKKKIDRFTSISINQTGNSVLTNDYEVPGSNISMQIDEAKLNFKFKTDKNWSELSPNSEFRIYINDSKLSETVKLVDANSNWKNASINGFNVLSNILIDNNVSLNLQLYIADDFILNESITVSIDEVILEVTFTVTVRTDKIETNLVTTGSLVRFVTWNETFQIEINYSDVSTGIGITGANFSVDWVDSNVTQEDGEGIYRIICNNTNTISGQTYFIDISVDDFGFLQNSLRVEVNIMERETEVEIFMEGTNMTLSPVIELPITSILNLTARYFDLSYSTPIENATASLYGILEANYIYTQEGDAHQFIIDTLEIGLGTHLISLVIENQNFDQISKLLRITVVPIQMNGTIRDDIQSVSISPGSDYLLEIQLRDEFGDLVQNIEVNYTWDGAPGTFTFNETSGYYTALLSDVPEGVFDIIITAEKGPNYDFEEYRITISSSTKLSVWQLVLIYFLAALIIALISGFGAYQLHYKYPPMVRDIRNLRRKLRKGRKTKSVLIDSREKIMDKIFQDKLRDSNIKSIKVKKIGQKAEKIVRTDEDIKKIAGKDSIKKTEKLVTDKKLPEKIKEKEKVKKLPDKKTEKEIADKEKKLKEKAEKEKIAEEKAAKKAAKKEKKSKEKTAEKEKSVMEKIAKEAAEKAKKVEKSPVKVGKKEEAKVKMSKISLPKKKDKKK